MEHTKGPWRLTPYKEGEPHSSEIMADFTITRAARTGAPVKPFKRPGVVARAYAWGGEPEERPAIRKANARLMAAAPDLLTALKRLLKVAPTTAEVEAIIPEAKAAIRKATGRS